MSALTTGVGVVEGGSTSPSFTAARPDFYRARCRDCSYVGPLREWSPEGMAAAVGDGREHGHTKRVRISVPVRRIGFVGAFAGLDWSERQEKRVEINCWSVVEEYAEGRAA